jgi:hypothetical protein
LQRQCQRPLQNGERKNLQSDHVVIVPGPSNEVALLRRVYEWFLKERVSPARIPQRLNDFGLRTDLNRILMKDGIYRLPTSEKYAGNNVCYVEGRLTTVVLPRNFKAERHQAEEHGEGVCSGPNRLYSATTWSMRVSRVSRQTLYVAIVSECLYLNQLFIFPFPDRLYSLRSARLI